MNERINKYRVVGRGTGSRSSVNGPDQTGAAVPGTLGGAVASLAWLGGDARLVNNPPPSFVLLGFVRAAWTPVPPVGPDPDSFRVGFGTVGVGWGYV